jgi:hypothetical protein
MKKWTRDENTYLFRFQIQFPEKKSHELASFLVGNWKMKDRLFTDIYEHIEWMNCMRKESNYNEIFKEEKL